MRLTEEEAVHFVRAVARAAGDEEWASRSVDARTTATRLSNGEAATGRIRLASLIGKEVVDKASNWLGIESVQIVDERDGLSRTDVGNAQRFVLDHCENVRFCHANRKWLIYEGRRWIQDDTGEVRRRAKQTVQGMLSEAAAEFDYEKRKKLVAWQTQSEFENRLKAMVSLAESEARIPVRVTDPFAVENEMILKNPVRLEGKPGENPTNGAEPFSEADLANLRQKAGPDMLMFLLLRWTGLRGIDAVKLTWDEVHFDRKEIERVTQKRRKRVILPISAELLFALENEYALRKPEPGDRILLNPATGTAMTRPRLYQRMLALGKRCGVANAHPHRFRDTLAVYMLSRGASPIAQILHNLRRQKTGRRE